MRRVVIAKKLGDGGKVYSTWKNVLSRESCEHFVRTVRFVVADSKSRFHGWLAQTDETI